jgi:hypothetical protein
MRTREPSPRSISALWASVERSISLGRTISMGRWISRSLECVYYVTIVIATVWVQGSYRAGTLTPKIVVSVVFPFLPVLILVVLFHLLLQLLRAAMALAQPMVLSTDLLK